MSDNQADVFVDVYGKKAPKAADFRRGATTREEVEKATDARRNQRPGDAEAKPTLSQARMCGVLKLPNDCRCAAATVA
jgi:hypothetical protein